MLTAGTMTAVAVAALFLLLFAAVRGMIAAATDRTESRGRLRHRRPARSVRSAVRRLVPLERLYGRLGLLLESARAGLSAQAFVGFSLLLLAAGGAAGALLVHSVKGTVLAAVLLGGMPYLVIRMLLAHRQMQSRVDFLPAVELFYQCYLTTGGRQVRLALARMVEERRLLGPLLPVFEQLYLNLQVKDDDEASLHIFVSAMGHLYADYFANLLRVALADDSPIAEGVKELIGDMRRAQRADRQERQRLLEIRIANFSPPLFLILFIGINMRYNPDGAYMYYVLDPNGRDMLLNAAALIFGSFLMGVYLSRRKL